MFVSCVYFGTIINRVFNLLKLPERQSEIGRKEKNGKICFVSGRPVLVIIIYYMFVQKKMRSQTSASLAEKNSIDGPKKASPLTPSQEIQRQETKELRVDYRRMDSIMADAQDDPFTRHRPGSVSICVKNYTPIATYDFQSISISIISNLLEPYLSVCLYLVLIYKILINLYLSTTCSVNLELSLNVMLYKLIVMQYSIYIQ